MTTPLTDTTKKPKRTTWTFDPPKDLENMMDRAIRDMVAPGKADWGIRSKIIIRTLRKGLSKYAGKRDLEIQSGEKP